jgi:hypothetical protein
MKNIASYTIIYKDRFGNPKTTIYRWFKLEYAKKEGDFGSLYLDLPDIYPPGFFDIDGRIEVWRQIGASQPYLEFDTFWMIRLIRKKYSKGDIYIHLLCHDATNIIDRRIVAYPCSSSYTTKNTNADKMILAIARENFGTLATDSARNISAYLDIDEDPSTSVCPVFEKSFCRQKVLPLFQDICEDSINNGVYLTFDVVYNNFGKPIFKTYVGQRGVDRTGKISGVQKFVFSVESGNLEYATVSGDFSEEYNFIYAGGSGKDDTRIIATAYNDSWINVSPYNRREDFIDARDDEDIATVQSEANIRLAQAGPKLIVNGHIIQTKDSIYGYHYKYGDVVIFNNSGLTIPIHLDTVNVVVYGSGDEDIKIYTRNLEDSDY